MNRNLRVAPCLILACVACVLVASGCASSSTEEGNGTASCARQITHDGHRYTDAAGRDITTGDKLGSTTFIECDDTGGRGEQPEPKAERVNVYEVEGLNRTIAVGVGSSPESAELFALDQEGSDLPDVVEDFIKQSPSQPSADS